MVRLELTHGTTSTELVVVMACLDGEELHMFLPRQYAPLNVSRLLSSTRKTFPNITRIMLSNVVKASLDFLNLSSNVEYV
jgi:hypothetical protein